MRRWIGYALAGYKLVVPPIFPDTRPPIQLANLTWVDCTRQSWNAAMAELLARLRRPERVAAATLPDAP